MKWILFPILALSLAVAGTALAQSSPTETVKKTVDDVIRVVSDKELKKPQNEKRRRQEIKRAIGAVFDSTEMAQRAMARHWRDRSAAEKKEFVELFESLLENSYAGKIESYNQEKVVYLKEAIDGEYAEVRSKIVTARRDEYSLDYRLMLKGGKWVVYDIVIEGVSLVSNYRTQFNKIISNQGYAELVKKLRSKHQEISMP
ncbi:MULTISPECIES: phospholipid-binding protein MlaC [Geobacter]|uniref:Organic solvent tolerance ABC transporter substrate-binding protein n=2 Tax=Geobacter TaxID=28231 RepID=A0A0C1QQU2_9BACT|nr:MULTISPECIES: ABC transporter substrate-binding protein [Geobacter]ANA40980.1 organic solvent tolerance ABC transporter substrate-binding protein [Geobacter anodireducens]KIE43082.1 organic solvent tolerance ABC transporter substrate-binding protein [Geobacter soli]MBE2886878.1 ABC transporter substrate-binding protein [Geobacter anodireducens]HMN02205.1 ABC transporter substrate-binding protein [Geobacter anodireducens]